MGRFFRPLLIRIDGIVANSLDQRFEREREVVRDLGRTLDTSISWQTEAMREHAEVLRHAIERSANDTNERVSDLAGRVDDLVKTSVASVYNPDWIHAEHLSANAAAYLSMTNGHTGPAAQAGLWFNPPITLQYAPSAVEMGSVNERVVEMPYASGAVTKLAPGASVLDVGGCESTISLELASLGYDVTMVDMRPFKLEHPKLRCVTARFESWTADRTFDAILFVSTIEHFGLGSYDGSSEADLNLDRTALEHAATMLNEQGELILTVPYGTWHVDDFQRTYDDEHLDALLAGWHIRDRRVYVQTTPATWVAEDRASGVDDDLRRVALLTATPVRPSI